MLNDNEMSLEYDGPAHEIVVLNTYALSFLLTHFHR